VAVVVAAAFNFNFQPISPRGQEGTLATYSSLEIKFNFELNFNCAARGEMNLNL